MNLAEAFWKTREQYGAEEALRRLAYWDSILEGEGFRDFTKGLGTRYIVSEEDVFDGLKIQRLKKLPEYILNRPAPKKGVCEASDLTLGHLIDRLLIDDRYPDEDGRYTAEELADKFSAFCFDLYKRNGMFLLLVYNGCCGFLKGLLPE